MTAPDRRHHAREGPLLVLVGKERFSENRAWSEMPQYWPAGLAGRAVIEVVGQGELAHTAALTSDYFAAASRRLGDALAGYLDHQPPAGLVR